MTTQFNYDKEAADLIISKFKDIPITWEKSEDKYTREIYVYFDGSVVGCNDEGLYLTIHTRTDRMCLVMRDSVIQFSDFSLWQQCRLHRFFLTKVKSFRRIKLKGQEQRKRNKSVINLNKTLSELARHG